MTLQGKLISKETNHDFMARGDFVKISNWAYLPFEEVFTNVSSGNAKVKTRDYNETGRYPVVDQGQDLIGGYTNNERSLCDVTLPVIVFGDHTRAIKYIDFPFCMGADGIKVLKSKIGTYPKYLYYCLQTLPIPDTGYNRHYKYLKEHTIPVPPLAEQRRIAAVLDKAATLRSQRQQALAKLDTLLQAVFLDMFGDPVTNPKAWETATLGDIAIKLQNGIGKGKSHYGTGVRVANISDLYEWHTFEPREFSLLEVNKKEIKKYRLNYGDLLFVRSSVKRSGVAYCSMYKSKEICLFSSFMIRVIVDQEKILPEFLSFQLRTPSQRLQLINAANTATITNISQAGLVDVKITIPDMDMQAQFLRRVHQLEAIKRKMACQYTQSEELFNSLQQRAFRGEL